ncbi:histidine phosphatase family protein [Candidatus Njordibacter sp. Uisw_039]|jgi:phosphohistidine phosphatase|uniref:SixA phosphatase family protein n=1 Tax=Candidatus Njordibacter sp. Uisw_039 TaxID=3230972 RepID=UPI003A4B49AB|tara:strand:+ start:1617 stop:2087 length:471 start_codon:yes stop_codon:yes gene_type:complete
MKLLLMRHGEASFNATTDAQRSLTQRGSTLVIQQSQNPVVPWHEFTGLWVSPYVRAQQTASLLLQNYTYKQHGLSLRSLDCITPHSEVAQVQKFLLAQQHEGIVLITHQPLISGLIGHFCHADEYLGEPMMPASMALLEGEMAAAGCLRLTHLFHP